jgi:hypothetical protein
MKNKFFALNGRDFIKGLARFNKKIDQRTKKVLWEAGWLVVHDENKDIVKTPFKKGDLAGSAQVIVDKNTVTIGYNREYAAWQHEAPWMDTVNAKSPPTPSNYTTPGTGPKFLESKLINNKKDYYEFIANNLWPK